MFFAQSRINSQCIRVTREIFEAILDDKNVALRCNNAKIDFEQAMQYGLDSEMGKKWHDECASQKKKLPAFVFMAGGVATTKNRAGREGQWRVAKAITLNGLCMLDVDHLDDAKATFEQLTARLFGFCEQPMVEETKQSLNKGWEEKYGVLLIHITPSGHGLRFVFKADAGRGNLADNQAWLAKELGVELDAACKDSSRLSFAVSRDHILYMNIDELINYNNEEFEKKYGEEYRQGNTQPCKRAADAAVGGNTARVGHRGNDAGTGGNLLGQGDNAGDGHGVEADGEVELKIPTNDEGKLCYELDKKLIPYDELVGKIVDGKGGTPPVGSRNQFLYDLVRQELRYICDFNQDYIFRVAPSFGLGEAERRQTIDQALSARRSGHSKLLRTILATYRQADAEKQKATGQAAKGSSFDHEKIWNTFKPFLDGPWKPVVDSLDDNVKFAGFLAAGAMFGTYLSPVKLLNFYDGSDWRLSFMVYIIGQAASGKGVFVELNRLIMESLRLQDEQGRKWEQQYKEDRERRSSSSSEQKKKAMEIEHFPIRVLPGTVSNAMRYKRMKDSVSVINGEEVHLHCYIFESELSAKLRSEQGTWAGAQDLDCKSFSNEIGGNDYANSQATNGPIEVNMNQVITGTQDAMNRKITERNCLDGLATRLVMFEMPDSSFQMLSRTQRRRTLDEQSWLRMVGSDLMKCTSSVDLMQKIAVPKKEQAEWGKHTTLSDALYRWGESEALRCDENKDRCADYFRRRAPIIAVRYAVVDAIMRDYKNFAATGKLKLTWKQVELALALASYFQEAQMYFFGHKVMTALEDAEKGFVPLKKTQERTKDIYAKLGDTFTKEDVMKIYTTLKSADSRLDRWIQNGIIKRKSGRGINAVFEKIQKVI